MSPEISEGDSDLCFLFLELFTQLALRLHPFGDLIDTLAWSGLVLEEVTLEAGDLLHKLDLKYLARKRDENEYSH